MEDTFIYQRNRAIIHNWREAFYRDYPIYCAKVLREQMAEFLSGLPATLAITLRYETTPITLDKIRRDLRDLHFKVDRKIFGRDFNQSAIRTSYWAVVQMLEINPHVHCGWHFPIEEDARILEDLLSGGLWQARYAMGGTVDVQRHYSGWAGYSCRELVNSDHLFLSDHRHKQVAA